MKYVLNKDILLRREWFGCLVFHSKSGYFWQFNEDAFEILRYLKNPISKSRLKSILKENDLVISDNSLDDFISLYEKQDLIINQETPTNAMVFFENKKITKKNCLVSPSSVTIYITDYCPKKCKHCATNAHYKINQKKELSFNEWIKIIKKLRESGVFMLVFSGGEPLSTPFTIDLLEIAEKMNFGLTLLTDYDSFSEEQLIKVKNLKNLVNIQTSLDGSNPKSHDFLRGKGSFEKALIRFKKFQDYKIDFTIAVAIHKGNINELNEIGEIANQFGASSVYLNPLAPYGRAKETMKNYLLDNSDLKKVAQKYLEWSNSKKVGTRNPFWKQELSHLNDKDYNPFANSLHAMSIGTYNLAITSKGDCYLDAKQRAEDILCLGNITKKSIDTLWNDSRLDKIRSLWNLDNFNYADQEKIIKAISSSKI